MCRVGHPVICGEHYGGPGERKEGARDTQSRSARPNDVVEERISNHCADDTQAEIQQHTGNGAVEEPASEAASSKADHDEDRG